MEGSKEIKVKHRFISRLITYWPVLLVLILLSLGGAWYYLQSFTPLYRATIKVSAGDQQVNSADSIIKTLRSKELGNRVVYDLQLYAGIFKKGPIKDIPAYANTPLFIAADRTVRIGHRDKVDMTISDSAVIVDHSFHPLKKWGYTAFGKFKFVKNPDFLGNEKDEFYISFIPVKEATDDILSRLHVSASGESPGIINLDIKDEVPQRAKDILNSLVKLYNASPSGIRTTNPRHDLKLIDQRIAKVEKTLLEIERKLHQSKSRSPAVHSGIIHQQKAETAFYTALLRKKEAAALALTLPPRPAISIVNANVLPLKTIPLARMLYIRAILAAIFIWLAIAMVKEAIGWKTRAALISATDYTPSTMVGDDEQNLTIAERLNKLKHAIRKFVSWDRLIRADSEQSITPINEITANDEVNKRVNQQRDRFLERLAKLKRITEAWADWKFFTKNNKPALREASGNITPYASINDPAIANTQQVDISNNLKIAEKEAEEIELIVEHELVQPAQEIVPVELSSVVTQEEPTSDVDKSISIAEQFSRLRQTLGELGINGDRKKVMITSAIPGEGKDFVATNLALSLALNGKKVILLDFDIHQPSLGNKLGVEQKAGISDYLKGKVTFEDIILATEIDKNLFFVPAGQVTNQEYELKMNDLVTNMLNQLGARFDHIIISAAPVRPYADAYVLSSLCDATLYIVRHAFSPKTFIAQFNKFNILNRLKNAAVIFNEA